MLPFQFESSRTFVVFSYSVGHGLLLLRSAKTAAFPTRIDVLIQDVRAMESRYFFEGIRIEETDAAGLEAHASKPAEMLEAGMKVYALRGNGWRGFVVGGVIGVHEDEQDFMSPSALLGSS